MHFQIKDNTKAPKVVITEVSCRVWDVVQSRASGEALAGKAVVRIA